MVWPASGLSKPCVKALVAKGCGMLLVSPESRGRGSPEIAAGTAPAGAGCVVVARDALMTPTLMVLADEPHSPCSWMIPQPCCPRAPVWESHGTLDESSTLSNAPDVLQLGQKHDGETASCSLPLPCAISTFWQLLMWDARAPSKGAWSIKSG